MLIRTSLSFYLWISDLVDEYQQYQEATVDEDDDDEDNYDDED